MRTIRHLTLVANPTKPRALELCAALAATARATGIHATTHTTYPLPPDALAHCDACAVLGGDGTLLGLVPQAVAHQVPLFGINRGKLGFLAHYPSENATESLHAVLRGDCQIVHRTLLQCRTPGGQRAIALNDIVVKAHHHAHMARLRVRTQGTLINAYRCDGLIVTTPTGSTAYNLSAGGPLIDPTADVFALTPICPHTLTDRTLIFPRDTPLTLDTLEPETPLHIAVDGIPLAHSQPRIPLEISLAEEKIPLIQPRGFSHFALLRSKLNL